MNITLHLTSNCNLDCRYCYVNKSACTDMDFETAKKSIDMALGYSKKHIGVSFFGGEPLVKKDLIQTVIEYTKHLERKHQKSFSFNMTTNGILLDEQFIKYSVKENIFISLSMDGTKTAHDYNRIDHKGNGTYDILIGNVKALLDLCPYTPVMQTVCINNLDLFYDSVLHLFDLGFVTIITSVNLSDPWTDKGLLRLKKQYEKLARLYFQKTDNGDKFYFSPFDTKINSYVDNKRSFEYCDLGLSQVSISPEGLIYPCVQFVGDKDYIIGNVDKGLDLQKRDEIYKISNESQKQCNECAVKNRCLSRCSCLIKQTTGSLGSISPILCSHERMLIPIADKIAEELYKKRSAMFIHKHYNNY